MEELAPGDVPSVPLVPPEQNTAGAEFRPLGTPVTAQEVKDRLSVNLYHALCDGNDANTIKAVVRAEIYVGSVLSYLGRQLDLDDAVMREIVLMHTVYELHMALGHEEAGREYRIQAKNMIVAAYGSYPDSDQSETAGENTGAVVCPRKNPRLASLHHAQRYTI